MCSVVIAGASLKPPGHSPQVGKRFQPTQTLCVLAAPAAAVAPDALFGLVAPLSARHRDMRGSGGPPLYHWLPGKGWITQLFTCTLPMTRLLCPSELVSSSFVRHFLRRLKNKQTCPFFFRLTCVYRLRHRHPPVVVVSESLFSEHIISRLKCL